MQKKATPKKSAYAPQPFLKMNKYCIKLSFICIKAEVLSDFTHTISVKLYKLLDKICIC